MIPKRFIQTYSSENNLLPIHQQCQESLKSLHPKFEYLFFSDLDCRKFIRERNPDFLWLWDLYPRGVQKADFFRVFAVYELGGFYADMDVFFHELVDSLITNTLVFPIEWKMSKSIYLDRYKEELEMESDLFQFGNYAFGAEPKHWFLREILEEMINRTTLIDMNNLKDSDILYSTGPDVVNSVYRKFRNQIDAIICGLQGETYPRPPIPKEWGEPEWAQFGIYGNHLMTGVWRTQ